MRKSIGFLISAILIVASGTVATITFVSIYLTSQELKQIVVSTEEGSKESNQNESLIDSLTKIHLNVVSLVAQKDIDQLEIQVEQFTKDREQLKQSIAECKSCPQNLKEKFDNYNSNLEKVLLDYILIGKKSQATDFFISQLSPEFESISSILSSSQKEIQNKIFAAIEDSKSQQQQVELSLEIISTVLILIFLSIGWLLSRKIKSSLQQTISIIHSTGDTLEKSSLALGQSSNQLSSSAMNSASSLEETVASLEEVSSLVERNSQGAIECAKIAEESLSLVTSGKVSIDELSKSISEMESSSKRIEEIVTMIEDISFQTNLLALNAAVEAARAGEQGKGFAVVADAVRTLAQRASLSAKEISTLIQQASKNTHTSATQANQSNQLFSKILESISKLNYITKEISEGSKEQSVGLKQISAELNHLDLISQNNSKEAVETSHTAQELGNQTKVLSQSIIELSKLAG